MKIFKKKCEHKWKVVERSNALQLDHMGYPLRLCLVKCENCGKWDQMWIDVPIEEFDEVKDEKSFLLTWK